MITVLMVDDHKVLIDGIKALFQGHDEIDFAFEALSGKTAVECVQNNSMDVVLLDINLGDSTGFEICKEMKLLKPEVKIVALTMHNESGYIQKMIKSGVDGYILKNAGKEEIEKAIETVVAGTQYFSAEVTQSLISGMHKPRKPKTGDFIQKLTKREKEILKLVVGEMTTDEIAAELFISSTTVISHRKSLLRKLNAKNTAGLVKAAYEFNLLGD